MPEPYSLDPDDDLPLVAEEFSEQLRCRRCGDPAEDWQFDCSTCGSSLRKQRTRNRAQPVAPPDGEIHDAEIVEVDDPFDVPVADVETDEFGSPTRPLSRRRPRRRPKKPTVGWHRLLPMFVCYGVMMVVSVAFGVWLIVSMMTDGMIDEEEQYWAMFAVESIDAVLVLIAAFAVGKLPVKQFDLTHRIGTWFVGFPLLAVLLVLNIGLVLFVRKVFKVEGEVGPPITIITLLLICMQPAIVEEWFFRHVAFESLREKMGAHWAVWTSGAMFALAHIFNPLGMPYLLLVGVTLGYLRHHSGSMLLPMILHFLHNLAVLYANRVI